MVYSVVFEGVVECSNTMEDEEDTELIPQALVYKTCRQRIYGVLLPSGKGTCRLPLSLSVCVSIWSFHIFRFQTQNTDSFLDCEYTGKTHAFTMRSDDGSIGFQTVCQSSFLVFSETGTQGPAVKEWFVFAGNPLKEPELVHPLPLSISGTSSCFITFKGGRIRKSVLPSFGMRNGATN